MQWIFNLIYFLLDKLFALLGSLPLPDFVDDLILSLHDFCVVCNYYFPLSTLIIVAIFVIAVSVIMMIVSAFLQLG